MVKELEGEEMGEGGEDCSGGEVGQFCCDRQSFSEDEFTHNHFDVLHLLLPEAFSLHFLFFYFFEFSFFVPTFVFEQYLV